MTREIDFATVTAQLEERVRGLYERARLLFGPLMNSAAADHLAVARDLARELRTSGALGADAARTVLGALVSEHDSEEFWRSPLGQVVAWHAGYPREQVPTKLVGALIGRSRQHGYQACVEAGLNKTLDGGWMQVPREGVVNLIRDRRPEPWSA